MAWFVFGRDALSWEAASAWLEAASVDYWDAPRSPKKQGVARQRRYLEAVAATERFYQELLENQWRLDALEAQLQAVVAADSLMYGDAAEARRRQANGQALARVHTLTSWEAAPATCDLGLEEGGQLLGKCLADIAAQHRAAVAALEERAKHYALVVQVRAGPRRCVDRLACSETEREAALERYRRLADDIYGDIFSQARAVLEVEQSAEGLHRLRSSLERSRGFWLEQLEETWAAWQKATKEMHRLGAELAAPSPCADSRMSSGSLALVCGYGRKVGCSPTDGLF